MYFRRESLLLLILVPLACGTSPELPTAVRSGAEAERGGGSGRDSDLARVMVAAHNRVRAAVETDPPLPPLTWSETLAEGARAWAEACRFEHNPQLQELRWGENLAAFTDATGSAETAVGNWAAEAEDFDLEANRCRPGAVCGHYTQLVWRDTREVGCAMVQCRRNTPFEGFPAWQLWVCNYAPPGNWVGERPF